MPFREIILTQRLLTLKIQKLKKIKKELDIREKPYTTKAYMSLLSDQIENNAIYCKGCGEPIDKSFVGKPIIINRNTTSYLRKWYHIKCAGPKNIIYKNLEGEMINVPN